MKRILILLCTFLLLTFGITACSAPAKVEEPAAEETPVNSTPLIDEAALLAAIEIIEADELDQKDIDDIIDQGEAMFLALRDHAFNEEELPQPHHYFLVLTGFDTEQYENTLFEGLTDEQTLAGAKLLGQAGRTDTREYMGATLPLLFLAVEEHPAIWEQFFADEELGDNLIRSINNVSSGASREKTSLYQQYIFLAVDTEMMDEAMAENLLPKSQDKDFYIALMSRVTTPEQYHVAKAAGVRLIIADSNMLFPCVSRLQEIADGKAQDDFDGSGSASVFKNFNTNTPSFTQGGSSVAHKNAVVVVRGSYDGKTFVAEEVHGAYMDGFGQFDIENIDNMPTSPSEIAAFVCIGESKEQVFTYISESNSSLQIPGMRFVVNVLMVNAKEGKIYASQPTIYGENPPDEKTVSGTPESVVGDYPYDEIKKSIGDALGLR